MVLARTSSLFHQFVEDELLRAPMLFNQVLHTVFDDNRRNMVGLSPIERQMVLDMLKAAQTHRVRLADQFLSSLREQVQAELRQRQGPAGGSPAAAAQAKPLTLSLVDEAEVAIEVQLSHAIEAIKSTAEYEYRELQTFVAAMVGDRDMAQDHNPFRPETFARACWAAAQALPLSRGHQAALMRQCATPLAQALRTSYAASSSRLEALGVEPAAFRTLILPSGSRRGARSVMASLGPADLHSMSQAMPAPADTQQGQLHPRPPAQAPEAQPTQPGALPLERWTDVARGTTNRADRQNIELVSRLFEAMIADSRMPQDIVLFITRLHGPAMRLALRDRTLLDHDTHPLWRFIDQLLFAAEMAPDATDPERVHLLRTAQATVDQLASEPNQNSGLYDWAVERLQVYLKKRLERRLLGLAGQIQALGALEARLAQGEVLPSTLSGPLDAHQLETVPAEFLESSPESMVPDSPHTLLDTLRVGDWLRLFLQGRWRQAQLLWRVDSGSMMLFGDGASAQTWAVRWRALERMQEHGLVKPMPVRSVLAMAAARVQRDVAAEAAA